LGPTGIATDNGDTTYSVSYEQSAPPRYRGTVVPLRAPSGAPLVQSSAGAFRTSGVLERFRF